MKKISLIFLVLLMTVAVFADTPVTVFNMNLVKMALGYDADTQSLQYHDTSTNDVWNGTGIDGVFTAEDKTALLTGDLESLKEGRQIFGYVTSYEADGKPVQWCGLTINVKKGSQGFVAVESGYFVNTAAVNVDHWTYTNAPGGVEITDDTEILVFDDNLQLMQGQTIDYLNMFLHSQEDFVEAMKNSTLAEELVDEAKAEEEEKYLALMAAMKADNADDLAAKQADYDDAVDEREDAEAAANAKAEELAKKSEDYDNMSDTLERLQKENAMLTAQLLAANDEIADRADADPRYDVIANRDRSGWTVTPTLSMGLLNYDDGDTDLTGYADVDVNAKYAFEANGKFYLFGTAGGGGSFGELEGYNTSVVLGLGYDGFFEGSVELLNETNGIDSMIYRMGNDGDFHSIINPEVTLKIGGMDSDVKVGITAGLEQPLTNDPEDAKYVAVDVDYTPLNFPWISVVLDEASWALVTVADGTTDFREFYSAGFDINWGADGPSVDAQDKGAFTWEFRGIYQAYTNDKKFAYGDGIGGEFNIIMNY